MDRGPISIKGSFMDTTTTRIGLILPLLGLLFAAPARAVTHEVRIPLHDGRLEVADLTAAMCRDVHLPALHLHAGAIDLNGWRGSLAIEGINAALGDGCSIHLSDDGLILSVDPEKLPRTIDADKRALRTFVATETPTATAAQARRWGLMLPTHVNVSQPLVILTHGLDTGLDILRPMGDLLEERGFQVAYFVYPNDQGLEDSSHFLAGQMASLREKFPGIRADIVAHSMGGLVARSYVEGSDYGGEVDHLILVGTPNEGSKWTRLHLVLKAQEEIQEWRFDPDWHASWMITDGLGEAARDLKPHSKFLASLNELSRRPAVQYTIIAGSQHAVARVGANWTKSLADAIPERAAHWWGIRSARRALDRKAEKLRSSSSKSDGPVSLQSAKLAGVSDFVVLHADHCALFYPLDGNPPVALDTIVDRLGKN